MKQYNDFVKEFQSGGITGYEGTRKASFHRKGKALLKALAKECGIDGDLRNNKGGPAVSGEITLHGDDIYIQIGSFTGLHFLLRTCKGRKDYCGGGNQYHSVTHGWEDLIERVKRIRG